MIFWSMKAFLQFCLTFYLYSTIGACIKCCFFFLSLATLESVLLVSDIWYCAMKPTIDGVTFNNTIVVLFNTKDFQQKSQLCHGWTIKDKLLEKQNQSRPTTWLTLTKVNFQKADLQFGKH